MIHVDRENKDYITVTYGIVQLTLNTDDAKRLIDQLIKSLDTPSNTIERAMKYGK
jgi:hypothetical protein